MTSEQDFVAEKSPMRVDIIAFHPKTDLSTFAFIKEPP
jgi:hypothetical protein